MSEKQLPIKYTSRDFNSIKKDLVEYTKKYYPDSFKDYNQSSFGALMLDTVAYVGDILSFYLDYQANESFLNTAVEINNVIRLGRQLGYKYDSSPSSYGTVTFYIIIPANTNGIGVDSDYIPVLKKGSKLTSAGGNTYTLIENVDFSDSSNEIVAAKFDDATSLTTYYAIKASGQIVSGQLEMEMISLGDYTPFLSVDLSDHNIAEIISVTDSQGHEWFQVEELSQDTIYVPIGNTDGNKGDVPFILKTVSVPRRFIVVKEYGRTRIQFGQGSEDQLTPEVQSINDPSQVVLKIHGRNYITDESFDPSNLISTDKLGISPSDTVIKIVYRINTSDNVNAATDTITETAFVDLEFPSTLEGASLDGTELNEVISSLELTNEEPIIGDVSDLNVEEIKHRINNTFAMQNRAVTLEDYKQLVYRMPRQFGAIKKCHVVRDVDSFKRNLNMYILSEDSDGLLLTANDTLKRNLKTWINRYKMINDTIDILDAEIVNFGIEFDLVSHKAINKFDALELATSTLINHFEKKVFSIGESIFITDIYSILNHVPGIADTLNVKIVQKRASGYSQLSFDVDYFTSPDARYVAIPQNAAFEMKFPSLDIKGTVR